MHFNQFLLNNMAKRRSPSRHLQICRREYRQTQYSPKASPLSRTRQEKSNEKLYNGEQYALPGESNNGRCVCEIVPNEEDGDISPFSSPAQEVAIAVVRVSWYIDRAVRIISCLAHPSQREEKNK